MTNQKKLRTWKWLAFKVRPRNSCFSRNGWRRCFSKMVRFCGPDPGCQFRYTYSTGIKELVIRREAISLQLQGYEIWNFSVVCTYSTPTPHKGLELFRAIFVFGCQKKFFSKNCYCRLKNLFQKLSFMLNIGNAKSYKFHFLKNIFRQFLRERH